LEACFACLDSVPEDGHRILNRFQNPQKPLTHPLDMMLARPLRLGSVSYYDLEDEVLLYSSRSERVFSLNSSAKAIWELCDGSHTIIEIGQELGQRVGCSGDELLSDIMNALREFREHGLLKLEEASRAEVA
jgi:Coenzyme PQQ synthesis protein D (PqqD)